MSKPVDKADGAIERRVEEEVPPDPGEHAPAPDGEEAKEGAHLEVQSP